MDWDRNRRFGRHALSYISIQSIEADGVSTLDLMIIAVVKATDLLALEVIVVAADHLPGFDLHVSSRTHGFPVIGHMAVLVVGHRLLPGVALHVALISTVEILYWALIRRHPLHPAVSRPGGKAEIDHHISHCGDQDHLMAMARIGR